jgi:hypothetical protein
MIWESHGYTQKVSTGWSAVREKYPLIILFNYMVYMAIPLVTYRVGYRKESTLQRVTYGIEIK